MAWYSGLTPKFRPISNGHRLVLHYHLIHTTTSPGPSLSHPSKAIDRLGKVLTSWKTASFDRGTPRKIVHLLEHKYSDAKLTEDGLEGRDAYVISALKDTIAQKSGFKLLLAHVELSARGHASCGPRQKWGRRQYLHSGNGSGQEVVEGADPALLEFKDPLDVQYELKLLQLRELNGTPLRDRVNLDELKAVESIPGDLTAALKRGQPDLTEYTEGKNKSLTGSLFRSFRQSVLIICPSERYFAFIYDKVFSKDALGTLRSSASAVPTGKERILIECVLGTRDEYSKPELQDVLQVVTTCACRWGSFTIWYKAMDGCRGWEGIDRIQQKGLLSALLSLHFDNATQSVCRVMTNEKCQSERIQFAFAACRELKAKGLPTNWILKPLKKDIRTITDLGLSELDVLVRTIAGAGGIQAVDDFVLPALTKKSDPGRTVAVVRGLQQELDLEGNSLVPPEERGHAERTINMLLSSTINDWKPYAVEREEPKAVISGMFSFAPMVAIPPSADMAINLVKAATETKNVALIETLAGKLMAIPELGDYFQITPKEAFRSIILPTLKDITESSERGPPQASLEKVVRQLKRGLSNVALEQKGLCQHDLRTVIFPALAGQVDAEYIRDG
ncbi:hypothetical protein FRC01_011073 [Tulasnella sp. 417]|nr:hypothetical protein FRC01_011073 [Tulasnella sp. 417]